MNFMVAHGLWKSEYYFNRKRQLLNEWHFVENNNEIMQHVLKLKKISLLPNTHNESSEAFFTCIHIWQCKTSEGKI